MDTGYDRSLSDLVRRRYSCRTFSADEIEGASRRALESTALALTKGLLGERVRLFLVDKPVPLDEKFADYGLISGARYFLAGAVSPSPRSRESYAFLLEHLVLKAEDLGLQTCWVGYFKQDYFRDLPLEKDEIRPSVVVVGHGAKKERFRDQIIRAAVRASRRRGWEDLFFEDDWSRPLAPENAGAWAEPLELVRLAPSSGNTQPWRVVKEAGRPVFHFFLKRVKKAYALRGLHQVDIGIAMSHFELGCREASLPGAWLVADPAHIPAGRDLEYRWTWRGA